MRAGQLTQRVEWYRRTIKVNEYNEQREEYSLLGALRADITQGSGTMSVLMEREWSTQSLQMSVRHYNDVHLTDRFRYNGNLYEVTNVIIDAKVMRKLITLRLIDDEI